MRILSLTIGTLFVIAIALATTHFWGLGRDFTEFKSPFFADPKTPWVALPIENEKFILENPQSILWLDVARNDKDELVVIPWLEARELKLSESPVEKADRTLLSKALEKFTKNRIVINVVSNKENIHEQLSALIGKVADGKFLFQSEFINVLTSLKELLPRQVYGTSQPDRMRFRVFDSLGILTAAPFKGDVYVASPFWRTQQLVDENLRAEIKRRKKKMILGPLLTKEDLDLALRLEPEGVIIPNPEFLNKSVAGF